MSKIFETLQKGQGEISESILRSIEGEQPQPEEDSTPDASRVQAEVRGWEEGARIAMKVDPAGPAMTLERREGRLRFLGAREVPGADLVIAFKHIDGALPVLLGLPGRAGDIDRKHSTSPLIAS
jgi:hypothetical protein